MERARRWARARRQLLVLIASAAILAFAVVPAAAHVFSHPINSISPSLLNGSSDSPEPTETAEPSDSPEPTETAEPSKTAEPSRTAEPTETAEPTHSPEISDVESQVESTAGESGDTGTGPSDSKSDGPGSDHSASGAEGGD